MGIVMANVRIQSDRVMSIFCFVFRPCCEFLGSVMSWPHSGQWVDLFEGVFRFERLYLHFLQCWAVEMRLPINPLMRRGRAMARRDMVM